MKHDNCVVGVDLGTTAIKAGLFSLDGSRLEIRQKEADLVTPKPLWAEQDPRIWHEGLCALIHELTAGLDKNHIKAVGISSQGISFVPVDASFKPLSKAISWLDCRAEEETGQLIRQFGKEKIFSISGKPASAFYTLPKLLWLRKKQPELFKQSAKFLCAADYAYARLTGKALTDPTMASGTMMFDVFNNKWNRELVEVCGLSETALPAVVPAAGSANPLTAGASETMGLKPGIPVFCAGQDQKTAAYGTSIREGIAALSLGTAAAFEILAGKGTGFDGFELSICPYIEKGRYVFEGCVDTAGAAIKWLKKLLAAGSYREMDVLAEKSPPGAGDVFFFPLLADKAKCGGMKLGTERGDFIRAVYEGIAFEIRRQLEMAAKAGAAADEFYISGGGAKGTVLCKIIADVTGYRLKVFAESELVVLGAAKIAAEGIGADGEEFAKKTLTVKAVYDTDSENQKKYDDIYHQYLIQRKR